MRPIKYSDHSQRWLVLIIVLFLVIPVALISFLGQKTPGLLVTETAESASQQGNDYWSLLFGVDEAENYVSQSLLTSDGSLYIAGSSYSFGNGSADGWLIKLDQTGQIQWQKTYGGSDFEEFRSLIETADGNIIVAGATGSFNSTNLNDGWVIKLDQNGAIIWQKTYGSISNNRITTIKQLDDGGYIFSGGTDPDEVGTYNAWLVRLDPAGNIIWEKSIGSPNNDSLGGIQQTSDGGFIASGTYNNTSSAWIVKLNSGGTVSWEFKYSNGAALGNIFQLTDGSYIASGAIGTATRNFDIYVLKIAGNGQVIWEKTYGTTERETGTVFLPINDNQFMAVGTINEDYWLIKLDGSGNIVWQKSYGEENISEVIGSLQRAANGDFYLVGTSDNDDHVKTLIIKVDGNGNNDNCNLVGSANGDSVTLTASAANANPTIQTLTSAPTTTTTVPQDSAGTTAVLCGGPSISTLSGQVLDNNAQPLPNTTISYQTGSVTTNGSGDYTISNLPPGTYTLVPTLAGYSFTGPSNHTITVPPDQSNLDFIGTPFVDSEFDYLPVVLKP